MPHIVRYKFYLITDWNNIHANQGFLRQAGNDLCIQFYCFLWSQKLTEILETFMLLKSQRQLLNHSQHLSHIYLADNYK